MIKKFLLFACFVFCAGSFAQTPNVSQMNWATIVGAGAPTQSCPAVVIGQITKGSNQVTVASTVGIFVNQSITGTGIRGGSTVSGVNTTTGSLSLSSNATVSSNNAALSFSSIGLPYVDSTTNTQYTCGVGGWVTGGSSVSGDLSGTLPSPSVVKVNGGSVPTSAPILSSNALSQLIAGTSHSVSIPANCIQSNSSTTTYTCTTAPTFTPVAGDHIQFEALYASTGSATLAVNGAGAATIKKWGGSGNLIANDLLAAHWVGATFDGTNWQLEGQLGNTGTSASYTSNVTAGTSNGWQSSTNQGAFNVGTLSYSDTGLVGSFQSNLNGYIYDIVQNTSTGASASACRIVGNSGTTASTNYGEFCMNSTGYTGVGEYNTPSAVLIDSVGQDLGIGTVTANIIHFFVNASPIDSMKILASGLTQISDVTIPSILAVSGTPTGTPATTGGTVAAGANYAKIVAVDGGGNQTTVSTETALVTTSTGTSTITWNWTAVTEAASYQIWVGASSGTEGYYYTSQTNSYVQTTPIASGTSGTMPTLNSTGTLTLGTGIAGVTTGVAATAGYVGQVISSLVPTGSGASIATSGTAVNMSSISLTAGDWDIEGSVNFVAGSATIVGGALHEVGFNTTTATLPVDGSEIYVAAPTLTTTSANFGTTVSKKVYNVSTTTTIYLVANGTFTAGTEKVYGTIVARRIR